MFTLGTIIGLDRTYCVNDAEGATQSDLHNYCVYQGVWCSEAQRAEAAFPPPP